MGLQGSTSSALYRYYYSIHIPANRFNFQFKITKEYYELKPLHTPSTIYLRVESIFVSSNFNFEKIKNILYRLRDSSYYKGELFQS